jgi:hypothetical protein
MNNICKNCKYFIVGEVDRNTMQKQTTCVRYPPVTHPLLSQQGVMMITVYPVISEESFCGEFSTSLNLIN